MREIYQPMTKSKNRSRGSGACEHTYRSMGDNNYRCVKCCEVLFKRDHSILERVGNKAIVIRGF